MTVTAQPQRLTHTSTANQRRAQACNGRNDFPIGTHCPGSPSLETVVGIAETFDTSIAYLCSVGAVPRSQGG
jgi:hypothetical protein